MIRLSQIHCKTTDGNVIDVRLYELLILSIAKLCKSFGSGLSNVKVIIVALQTGR